MLGLSPKDFGEMTIHEFYAKVQGFGWQRLMAARDRAHIIASIANASLGIRRALGAKGGKETKVDTLCPITNPPDNVFFRSMFG